MESEVDKNELGARIKQGILDLKKYESKNLKILRAASLSACLWGVILASFSFSLPLYGHYKKSEIQIFGELSEAQRSGNARKVEELKESFEYKAYIPWMEWEKRTSNYLFYGGLAAVCSSSLLLSLDSLIIFPRRVKKIDGIVKEPVRDS